MKISKYTKYAPIQSIHFKHYIPVLLCNKFIFYLAMFLMIIVEKHANS
jgi:hypothetical protein